MPAGFGDYLTVCDRRGVDPMRARRADVAAYVRDLTERPSVRGRTSSRSAGAGLANSTIQQRLLAVRLFYDHLVEDARCGSAARGAAARGSATLWNLS
jgi:integrase/recombinase XerD